MAATLRKFSLWAQSVLLFLPLAGLVPPAVAAAGAEPPAGIVTVPYNSVAKVGTFYVGGRYEGASDKTVMHGSMYVEVMVPRRIRHPYPVVFVHGVGQSGAGWLQTPDGRPGWAHDFLGQGYVVYLVDLPARGRSPYVPDLDGPLGLRTAQQLMQMWTLPSAGSGSQAAHSQWPGAGVIGDASFDDFIRGQAQYPSGTLDQLTVDACIALLDRIGSPVILLTHSLGGMYGWSIADARPAAVKAIVAVEPAGPPIQSVDTGKLQYNGRANLPWGLTNLPLTYEPAVAEAGQLTTALSEKPVQPGTVGCYVQTGTPRQLTHLRGIPVLLVAGEASYHRIFDECTAQWLSQAGVRTEYRQLGTVGLKGNGHQMMMEKNSAQIAANLLQWLAVSVKTDKRAK